MHKGFVYRTVPHVTLKSIANNPDIQKGMTREQIDKAIAKHAETETLYDQPYEDKDIVRLTGPFTVENLSPHRALPIPDEKPAQSPVARPVENYLITIIENLRTAGVKGMEKSLRVEFSRLDTFPGSYIHAEGETTDGKAVRISIGPGTCLRPGRNWKSTRPGSRWWFTSRAGRPRTGCWSTPTSWTPTAWQRGSC